MHTRFALSSIALGLFLASGSSFAASCAPAWSATVTYGTAGTTVSQNGHNYSNKWWTLNEDPSKAGTWGVWNDLGVCESGNATPAPTVAPTSTPVVTATPKPTAAPTAAPSTAPTAAPTSTPSQPPSGSCSVWAEGASYKVGDVVSYNGVTYTATSAHTAFVGAGWTPATTPTLWKAGGSCSAQPTPVVTASPVPSSTPTVTPTAKPTVTPTATPTAIPTSTPSSTPKPSASPTATPSATPTATPVVTPTPTTTPAVGNNEQCRPDGLVSSVANVPYCLAYDTAGREKLANGLQRRNIGYFANWRTGKDPKQGTFLAHNIPWNQMTHINYAFAHVDGSNKVSVNADVAGNESTQMTWPNIPEAAMDASYSYQGHFNQLNKYKKQHPGVRTLVSIGGWAETGGYFGGDGKRVASGGFYSMTTNADGTVNTAGINAFADSAVAFIRQYGFDGVDIDYEYPTTMENSGNPLDWSFATPRQKGLQAAYRELMRALREKLDTAAVADGKYYQLTAAVPASGYLLRGMEAFQAIKYLDFVNVMSYDLHGTWNQFVGPNAALYDDGKDGELAFWQVYTDPQYQNIGYLNTDWAYHYYRGAVPAGRINVGVPYYTRGWSNVTGGNHGLWGTASTNTCPPGVEAPCGIGAKGIDNIWFDVDEKGSVEDAGSNPMWHAKNLEKGIAGDYLKDWGFTAADIVGKYDRYFDPTLVAPWLWNEQKKVFLSTEDEESMAIKADWIIKNGIGGAMNWELAGDYDWDANRTNLNGSKGQYVPGSTLSTLLANKFRTAAPYGNTRAKTAMPAQVLDVKIDLVNYALGEKNYPIEPKLQLINNTGKAIPAGSKLTFQYPVSAPNTMQGSGVTVVASEHTGSNIGGYKGDFHTVEVSLPALAIGATKTIGLTYNLPIAGPSNYVLTVNGKTFATKQEFPQKAAGSF
ncbi:glycosyl hydrolase family 18 protein [Chitinibacter sp. ZOR0017]|uniref:glycosyl hydrolase family 18 protein n=1 Tax=Chitinibacter sp. ZOR0017 TaxID=1339254 RepID=UPI000AE4DF51|nr:glycosyl hydrolase family 18 protein [Chitinibacter sp. ZOR0017]